MKRRIEIGDQDFDVCERFTLEQELYLAGLIRRGKLDRIPLQLSESRDRVAERLIDALERSHVGRQLLSALIVPAGEAWTVEQAAKTAEYLKEWGGAMDDNAATLVTVVIYQALFDRGVIGRWDGRGDLDMTGGD